MYDNEQNADYQRDRYKQRMALAIKLLGTKCSNCGSTLNLHLDHIDPQTKFKNVSSLTNMRESKFLEEVAKCQLLCDTCHAQKHHPSITHGTLTMYRYCKCAICKEAKRIYMQDYYKRRKER